jgi:HEAT repeat protein
VLEQVLEKARGDEELELKKAAAYALGKIGDPKAIPALERALEDKFFEVNDAASEALERIRGY